MNISPTSLALCVALGVVVGCKSEIEERDPAPIRAEIVASVFGDDVEPELVVARVDGRELRAYELAAYLAVYPTLTVDQAIADMVDIRVGLQHLAEGDDRLSEHAAWDGRVRGLVFAWLQQMVWSDPLEPDPETIDAFSTNPDLTVLFGTPALRQVSQFVVLVPEESEDREALYETAMQQVADALAELRTQPRIGRPEFEATADALQPRIVAPLSMDRNMGLRFPRTYSGPLRWSGIDDAVEEFADASWNADIGELVGPIRSEYGAHAILVEREIDSTFVSEEEQQAIITALARFELEAPRVSEAVQDALRVIAINEYPDAIDLLTQSMIDRMRMARESTAGEPPR